MLSGETAYTKFYSLLFDPTGASIHDLPHSSGTCTQLHYRWGDSQNDQHWTIWCKIMLKCNEYEGIIDVLEVKQSEMVTVK